jgi:molecular chaperone Hsp33
MDVPKDCVLRALTDDDTFRVIVAVTASMVEDATRMHGDAFGSGAVGQASRLHYANLLTGAVLIRETMAPGYRMQAVLRGAAGGRLVADAHASGMTRGLVELKEPQSFELSHGCSLEVMRSIANGRGYRSIVQPSGSGGVPDALMVYLQESEQIVSVISAGATWSKGAVSYAGGYVVQLLPGAARGPLMVMAERLSAMSSAAELVEKCGGDAKAVLDEVLYSIPYSMLEERPVFYGCHCSRESVLASLGTLPKSDLVDLSDKGEVLEIDCDYCSAAYKVAPAQLRGLLQSS